MRFCPMPPFMTCDECDNKSCFSSDRALVQAPDEAETAEIGKIEVIKMSKHRNYQKKISCFMERTMVSEIDALAEFLSTPTNRVSRNFVIRMLVGNSMPHEIEKMETEGRE